MNQTDSPAFWNLAYLYSAYCIEINQQLVQITTNCDGDAEGTCSDACQHTISNIIESGWFTETDFDCMNEVDRDSYIQYVSQKRSLCESTMTTQEATTAGITTSIQSTRKYC